MTHTTECLRRLSGHGSKLLQVSPYLRFSQSDEITDRLSKNRCKVGDLERSLLKTFVQPRCMADLILSSSDRISLGELVRQGMLVDPDTIWNRTNLLHLEIETTTHCNRRCRFCPVRIQPKEKQIMDLDSFAALLDQAEAHGNIRTVSFTSYNEPCLDPLFTERIRLLAATRMKLELHTNGDRLSPELIRLLVQSEVLDTLFINLPSVDYKCFQALTGSDNLEDTLGNIDRALAADLPVSLSVQGTPSQLAENLPDIRRRFESALVDDRIEAWGTTDRAGMLTNEY
ncbi:MAG: radical SAM protein, partial [Candidatus Electrothrix sp.]